MPIPLDPTINITRSFAFKLGLPAYSSADFFMSAGTQCLESQAHETANRLYDLCYDQVSAEVATYRHGQAAIADEVLHPEPERTQAPEVSPFRVTAAPTTDFAPSNEVEKMEHVPEIQVRRDEDKGVIEKSKPISTSNPDGWQPIRAEPVTPRRGRPPKAQQNSGKDAHGGGPNPVSERNDASPANLPSGNAVPPAEAADAVKSPDQFQADDSDLPKEIGGTSEVPPGPDLKAKHEAIRASEAAKDAGPQLVPPAKRLSLGQVERLTAISAVLAKDGKRTQESIDNAMKGFIKAFLNTPEKLKKPPMPEYEPIVPIMERIVETNPGVLMADPAKAGLEAGVGYNKLIRHVDKWRPELKDLAISLAVNRYPENCYDLLDFLHNIAKLGNLDRQLYTFMLVFKNFNAAVAMGLKSASDETQKPMTELVDGLDLATCTEGELLGRLSGNQKSQKSSQGKLWDEA